MHLAPAVMEGKMRRRLVAFLVILILAAGFGYRYFQNSQGGNRRVELREDGFYPKELTIRRGDVVEFVTTNGEPFWPASNSHPLHKAYPEFDPKRPIPPHESWSFEFDKEGEWLYHDHLSAYFIGRINVVGENEKIVISVCSDLRKLPLEKKEQCWEDMLNDALLQKGVKYAFQVFTQIYASDPDFILTSCHQHAHTIGDFAYAEYRKSQELEKLELPPETVYCNYGFYHGFIGHMIEDNPDPQVVYETCDFLEKKYNKTIPEIRQSCYHAAGHGLVPEPLSEKQWGDAQAMIANGLTVCDQVSTMETDVRQCLDGVFNVIAIWTYSEEYGLKPDEAHPFSFCEQQANESHLQACLYELAMPLTRYVRQIADLTPVIKRYISVIKDENAAKIIINAFVAGSVTQSLVNDEIENYIAVCRALKAQWQESCFRGVAGGLVAHGHPGQEHLKGFAYCLSRKFSAEEQWQCFGYLFNALHWVYNDEKIIELCGLIPENYRTACFLPLTATPS